MSSIFLGNALFFIIGFAWVMYLIQEVFITGSSFLNIVIVKNEQERAQIQYASGLHWDGIEVWLLAALMLTLGAFPTAFSMIFSYLYVIIYVLLYSIIARGVVIETLYKLDNPKWVRINSKAWAISSALIIVLLGVYITNLFLGFPLDQNGFTGNFLSILSTTSIAGGVLFFLLSLTAGASFIALQTEGELGLRGLALIKKIFIPVLVPVVLLLVFMGFNVNNQLFVGELFTSYPVLFSLPAATILFSLGVLFYGQKRHAKGIFISSLLTLAFYLITGFIGSFPNVVSSNIDNAFALQISDIVSEASSTTIIFYAAVVFFPIVIGYQLWKYIHFKKKLTKDLR